MANRRKPLPLLGFRWNSKEPLLLLRRREDKALSALDKLGVAVLGYIRHYRYMGAITRRLHPRALWDGRRVNGTVGMNYGGVIPYFPTNMAGRFWKLEQISWSLARDLSPRVFK